MWVETGRRLGYGISHGVAAPHDTVLVRTCSGPMVLPARLPACPPAYRAGQVGGIGVEERLSVAAFPAAPGRRDSCVFDDKDCIHVHTGVKPCSGCDYPCQNPLFGCWQGWKKQDDGPPWARVR